MKRTIIILLAAMFIMSSVSLAEDLSSLPDADLLSMYRQISIELESRGIDPKAVYPEDAFSGDDLWNKDIADRLDLFFGFWNASDIPNMLTVCSPGWKADKENPDIDLLAVLGSRTPADYEILSVSAEATKDSRIVSLIAGIDRNNGKDPQRYFLQITMTREEDGTWYVDPDSLKDKYTAGDILPVMTARYIFSGLTADPADETAPVDEDAFTVPNIIPAKGIEDFIGEWHYFRIVNEDGTEMSREELLAEGLIDAHAEIIITKEEIQLYAASLDGAESVKYEFVPDDGSLRILNGSDELPVLHLTDNGMLLIFIPAYNSPSGDTIAYLIREEP